MNIKILQIIFSDSKKDYRSKDNFDESFNNIDLSNEILKLQTELKNFSVKSRPDTGLPVIFSKNSLEGKLNTIKNDYTQMIMHD